MRSASPGSLENLFSRGEAIGGFLSGRFSIRLPTGGYCVGDNEENVEIVRPINDEGLIDRDPEWLLELASRPT